MYKTGFVDNFLNHYTNMGKSENTIIGYETDLKQFYKEMSIGDDDINNLTSEDILTFIDILKEKGISNRSINRKLSCVSAFYTFLFFKGEVSENIFKRIGKLNIESVETKHLEEQEAKELLSLAKEKMEKASPAKKWLKVRDLLIIEVLLSCGIRAFELEALTLGDIELTGKHRGRITIQRGKGNKKRAVYIPEKVVKTYEMWLHEREVRNIECEQVFVSLNKVPLCKRQIQNIISGFSKELNFDITTHGLRHTFATLCIGNNADLKSVSKVLGHSTTTITEKVYIHSTEKDLKDCRDNNPLF